MVSTKTGRKVSAALEDVRSEIVDERLDLQIQQSIDYLDNSIERLFETGKEYDA